MTEQCCASCNSDARDNTPQISDGTSVVQGGYVSEYHVSRMDCPSEEGVIRMALDSVEPKVTLEFDTPNRIVRIFHGDNADVIEERMHSVGLGATLEITSPVDSDAIAQAHEDAQQEAQKESGILKWLLAINGIMFVIEITIGWWAQSTGLIADSLDLFADAAVCGVALYAVGRSTRLQLMLAFGALSEVVRRFMFGSEPASVLMMSMGLAALAANVLCLVLIAKSRNRGAHMKASWIFSANDVIANLGVILAGGLVAWTGSRYPDLVIGLIIGVVVLNGARRILQLKS